MAHAATCLSLIGLLALPQLAAGQENLPDWMDRSALEDGEVVYRSERAEQGTVSIDVAIVIDADREAIWHFLTACEVSPDYVPHVVECRSIGEVDDGAAELFEQTVKPAFFLPRFDHVFRLDFEPPDRIVVSHVSGPIDRMEGLWQLIERPDGGFIVRHQLVFKPGFPVPRFFVRNTLERDLPKVLREIRQRAEAYDPG